MISIQGVCMFKSRKETQTSDGIMRRLQEAGFMSNLKKVTRMKHTLLAVEALLIFSTVSCERIDKAFETLDKAKNLKKELEKKTGVTG
jgi:hypothetical protein